MMDSFPWMAILFLFSTMMVLCRDSAIQAFYIWPADNGYHINIPGKIGAVCTNGKNTTTIAYGFNGTTLAARPSYCRNATLGGLKRSLLPNNSWTYRYDSFMTFLRVSSIMLICQLRRAFLCCIICRSHFSKFVKLGEYPSCWIA